MSIFDYFRSARTPERTAAIAKERLQIIVAHERGDDRHDGLLRMQKELLAVIAKYFPIENDQVKVELDKQGNCSILELNITLPHANDITAPV